MQTRVTELLQEVAPGPAYMEPITTARLIVRRPTRSDLNDYLAYRNDPAVLERQPIQPLSEQQALAFLAMQEEMDCMTASGWIMFSVELGTERRMIGEVGIYIPEHGKQGDAGWSFNIEYHGHGYATEAAEVLMRFAFEQRQLHRVTASCDELNLASIRVMQKLGLRREASFKKNEFRNGEWVDTCTHAILREEWHLA